MRTRVKICGLTCAENIADACSLGADAIGLVFYPKSSRYITADNAALLRSKVPAFVSVVALFVNPTESYVRKVLNLVKPCILQFHGDESPEFCSKFGVPYIKSFGIGSKTSNTPFDVYQMVKPYNTACGWLFDTYTPGFGGSGKLFNHDLLTAVLSSQESKPIILAGGLNPDNVKEAILKSKPYAVDVSSGVESNPGLKNYNLMEKFMLSVKQSA